MRSTSRLWVLVITLLAALAAAGCGEGDDRPYRIGVMESLTGPGETYGNVAVRAKQMAADEINAAGGIDGRMLELVVEDSKCSALDAITAYQKLTNVDEMKIILGTSCSGAMLGVAPLAEDDGVILFSGLASNPDIANAGDYIFRTQISDIEVGIKTGDTLWADGIRRLSTITEETDYAEGVRRTTAARVRGERRPGGRLGAVLVRHSRTSGRSSPSSLRRTPMRCTSRPSPNPLQGLSSSSPGSWVTRAPSTARRSPWAPRPSKSPGMPRRACGRLPPLPTPTTRRRKRSWPTSASSTTTSRCPGTWARRTTTCTSLRSA